MFAQETDSLSEGLELRAPCREESNLKIEFSFWYKWGGQDTCRTPDMDLVMLKQFWEIVINLELSVETHTYPNLHARACTHRHAHTHSHTHTQHAQHTHMYSHTCMAHTYTHINGAVTRIDLSLYSLYFASFSEEKKELICWCSEMKWRIDSFTESVLLECFCMFDKIELKSINCSPTPWTLSSKQW